MLEQRGLPSPPQTSRGGSRQSKRQTERGRGRGQERSTPLQRLKEPAAPKGPQQGPGPQAPQLFLPLPGEPACDPASRNPRSLFRPAAPARGAGPQRVLPSLPAATRTASRQRGPSQAYRHHLSPKPRTSTNSMLSPEGHHPPSDRHMCPVCLRSR